MNRVSPYALPVLGLGALLTGGIAAAQCPALTLADDQGIESEHPQQFELAEFQDGAGCELGFSENPAIAELNARITGNPETLPPVAERLPSEPLVVVPYQSIGRHGGTLDGLSNATEAGTSDLLSIRHVNLVRYSDDLQTIVPNVARSWEWNDDYTELTMVLREGHKWSDGAPFTAEDIAFWLNDLILNENIFPSTPTTWLFDGEPMGAEAVDETTIRFTFPVPTPGILNRFAVSYIQPFQPKHFLSQFHGDYNDTAQSLAEERGYESWGELLNVYYGGSDWKDVPSPLLQGVDDQVMPTLESHILIEESTEGRRLVANPFFHMVDTQGQQLPYISEIDERYVPDKEVRNLRITSGAVDYKSQNVFLEDFPLYKENEERGNYSVQLARGLGENIFYSFNTTHKDPVLREIFNDVRFRQAMSVALDREEINELVYLGQGEPQQSVPADPNTVGFVTDEHLNTLIQYDPDMANQLLDEMGLTDSDNDGVRERPDGQPLVLQLAFSNQGAPVRLHEVVQGHWADVGVRMDAREVTSDEYRASAQANDLDLTVWKNDNTSGPTISQEVIMLAPPFGDQFNPGTGFEWAAWIRTDGAEGIEPPDDAKRLVELASEFQQLPLGSEESNRVGAEIVDIHVNNLWKIGIIGNVVTPAIVHNDLKNVPTFTAKTYDYYWVYPYRPAQWYFVDGE